MSDTTPRPAHTRVRPRHARRLHHRIIIPAVASVLLAVMGFYGTYVTASAALIQANANTQDISSLLGDTGSSDYISAPVASGSAAANPVDSNAGQAINILVIGSDVRSGENAALGGYVAGARGDTTIIVHISADRQRVELVSIPRDARVQISTCESFDGKVQKGWLAKFNVAFANGYDFNNDPSEAAACVMRTVTDLTGVEFNGNYIVADFAGFKDMVNALGGVPMCIPYDMVSKKADLNLKAGAQILYGDDALALARARYGLGDGTDLGRIQRQQELIGAILKKALSVNAFTNIDVLTQFVKAATQSFTMSENFGSVSYDFGLLYSLRNIDLANVTMVTTPWAYAGDGSGDVVITSEAKKYWTALINDQPIADIANSTSTTASPDPSASASAATDEALMYLPIPPEGSYVVERQTEDQILAACTTG
ncbi:LCP family protein [Demequina capsici]|uniref:LCP family protein n=1 Tax=Demequina capsici TaxID=3075620 RepID=A0AA96F4G4_9MICO|nr:LCP family protein [Demequina sp. OYTSA14]WNM23886.1 LCP family protein [Demequina sp. OYTSA14]